MIVGKGEKLPPDQRGYAQNGLGIMLIASGNRAQAQVLFEQALALFRQLGDKLGIAITTGSLGHLTAPRREYTQATLLLTESLALHQELGNDVSINLGSTPAIGHHGTLPCDRGGGHIHARWRYTSNSPGEREGGMGLRLPGPRAARGSAVVNRRTWKKPVMAMRSTDQRTLG
jgi:Tetratricopeptide repeat